MFSSVHDAIDLVPRPVERFGVWLCNQFQQNAFFNKRKQTFTIADHQKVSQEVQFRGICPQIKKYYIKPMFLLKKQNLVFNVNFCFCKLKAIN